jgi:hypothetical protein
MNRDRSLVSADKVQLVIGHPAATIAACNYEDGITVVDLFKIK